MGRNFKLNVQLLKLEPLNIDDDFNDSADCEGENRHPEFGEAFEESNNAGDDVGEFEEKSLDTICDISYCFSIDAAE